MRMAMKAKMAADKENQRAEKRHQEVCLRDVICFLYRNNAFFLSKKMFVSLSRVLRDDRRRNMQCQKVSNSIGKWPVAV